MIKLTLYIFFLHGGLLTPRCPGEAYLLCYQAFYLHDHPCVVLPASSKNSVAPSRDPVAAAGGGGTAGNFGDNDGGIGSTWG